MFDKGKRKEKDMFDLKEYKFSRYNHKIVMNGNVYMYNAFSGGFCKFRQEFKEKALEVDFNDDASMKKIAQFPDEVIGELIKGCFVIPKGTDEFAIIKSRHLVSRFSDNNALSLTLVPTMACNFRCTYCFEADKNYPCNYMSDEVIEAIITLIDTKLKDGGELAITWYGGEPLIRFDIIKKLQIKVLEIAKKKNLSFNSAIITNGFLLTKQVSDEFVELGIRFAQVTIDGTREIHDAKRIAANGQGTFDTIIENILEINKDLTVSIRVNIEKDNVGVMSDFMDYLIKIGIAKAKNIKLYFAVVKNYGIESSTLCNHYTVKEFAEEEVKLNELAYSKGIYIKNNIDPNVYVCGSLSPKTFVIEPDGTMQKCWGLVGEKESAIGNILDLNASDACYIQNLAKWYSWTKFENEECRECNVLPVCMGGCPLHTLDGKLNEDYKCSTYKYNLEKILSMVAKNYANNLD